MQKDHRTEDANRAQVIYAGALSWTQIIAQKSKGVI